MSGACSSNAEGQGGHIPRLVHSKLYRKSPGIIQESHRKVTGNPQNARQLLTSTDGVTNDSRLTQMTQAYLTRAPRTLQVESPVTSYPLVQSA